MQNLNNAKVEGNRIFLSNGYIQIKVCNDDLDFIVVTNEGKTWCFDTLEEALEAIK